MVPTRHDLLLLLHKHPGSTVAQLAAELGLTTMGVRRHLELLSAERLVESAEAPRHGLGRPASGWRLTAEGLEQFPRRYANVALEILEDIADLHGAAAVDEVLASRTDKQAAAYLRDVNGATSLEARVAAVATLRDDDGYSADSSVDGDGFILTEHNCAVHRVAERYPAVCAQELALLQRVLGPDVEVTRVAHTMAGDPHCAYRVTPHS